MMSARIKVAFSPSSSGRFAALRENARIFLFIAVLISIWIKRAMALIALLSTAH
jgi:hypothetical protein